MGPLPGITIWMDYAMPSPRPEEDDTDLYIGMLMTATDSSVIPTGELLRQFEAGVVARRITDDDRDGSSAGPLGHLFRAYIALYPADCYVSRYGSSMPEMAGYRTGPLLENKLSYWKPRADWGGSNDEAWQWTLRDAFTMDLLRERSLPTCIYVPTVDEMRAGPMHPLATPEQREKLLACLTAVQPTRAI
jgi:hypothetical protein